MSSRRFGLLLAPLVSGIVLASTLLSAANAQDVIKVGVITTLTGPAAPWGIAMASGVQMAAKEVNDKGGLKVGTKSYRIEVIAYDEQYKAGVAISAAQRLISQDGARFIIGPLSSAGTLAVRDILQQNKIIAIATPFTRKALDPSAPFLFRMFSTPVEYSKPIVHWLKENLPADVRRVVIVNPNDETGWDSQDLLSSAYPQEGFTIVGKELFERALRDFQPILTKLLAVKPDIIEMGTAAPATAGLIVRQARELGYKGRFVKIGGPGPREIVEAAGKEAAEGVINYMYTDTTNPSYQRMAEEFKKEHGHDANDLLPIPYDAMRILMAAIQNAGTATDTEKVRQSIAKVTPFKSVLGDTIRLGGKESYGIDTQFLTPAYIGVIKDGKIPVMHQVH